MDAYIDFYRKAPSPWQKSPHNGLSAIQQDKQDTMPPLQPRRGIKQEAHFLPGTGLDDGVGRELKVQDRGRGLRLTLLSIYTCRAEHQSLEDVWQRDDALNAGAIIYHHQSMHLTRDTTNKIFFSIMLLCVSIFCCLGSWLPVCHDTRLGCPIILIFGRNV